MLRMTVVSLAIVGLIYIGRLARVWWLWRKLAQSGRESFKPGAGIDVIRPGDAVLDIGRMAWERELNEARQRLGLK